MKSFETCTHLLLLHLERSQSVCSSLKTQRGNKMVLRNTRILFLAIQQT